MKITVLVLSVLMICFCSTSRINAHAVGNRVNEQTVAAAHQLRLWTNTATNTTYRATFLLIYRDEVFLEDAAGKVITVPFAQLSVADRAIADEHRERIRTLNRSPEFAPMASLSSSSQALHPRYDAVSLTIIGMATVLALTLLVLFCIGTLQLIRNRRLSLRMSFYAASAALLLVILLAASPTQPTQLIAQTLNIYSKGIAYPTPVANLRSIKLNPKVVISSTLSSTALSFDVSAVDSMKVINTTTDPALMDAAFAPYKPSVTTSWDDTYFYAAGNGIPAQHNMMIGITAWIAQVPIPQPYTGTNKWSIPLKPEYATTPLSIRTNFMKGAIAIAVNGLPIFNALNASGEDSKAKGELDQWGGHCGRADDYHYHVAPLQFEATSGLKPIAFALDGYAVYGSKEPDGTPMTALDQYHGHVGGNGVYHYHGTTTSPYMIESMRGKVALDPKSTAPENQIIPQAMTTPLRMTPYPINPSSTITNLTANAAGNGYLLEYTTSGKKGSVNYSWTGNGITGLYTFTFNDVDGKVTVQTFQR
jgi:hypothetical protein